MLNKITGWESRTVPPLNVLIPCFFGESQSLESSSGKAKEGVVPQPQGMSQKTYELVSSHLCVIMEVCIVAEKRLRCPWWHRSLI